MSRRAKRWRCPFPSWCLLSEGGFRDPRRLRCEKRQSTPWCGHGCRQTKAPLVKTAAVPRGDHATSCRPPSMSNVAPVTCPKEKPTIAPSAANDAAAQLVWDEPGKGHSCGSEQHHGRPPCAHANTRSTREWPRRTG